MADDPPKPDPRIPRSYEGMEDQLNRMGRWPWRKPSPNPLQLRERQRAQGQAVEQSGRPVGRATVSDPLPETSNPMHYRDRRFWVILGIWATLAVGAFGTGIGAFISGSPHWGFCLSAAGLIGAAVATIHLLETKLSPPQRSRVNILMACIAALTWAFIGWQTYMWFHVPGASSPTVVHNPPSEADIQSYLRTHPRQLPPAATVPQLKLGPMAAIAMAESFKRVPGHWIVYFTFAPENFGLRDTLTAILRVHMNPWIMEAPDASVDLDAPKFPPPPSEPGITLHGINALNDQLSSVLGACFVVRHTEKKLAGLEDWQSKRLSPQERTENRAITWIEIGHGSPWRTRGPLDNCLH